MRLVGVVEMDFHLGFEEEQEVRWMTELSVLLRDGCNMQR